MAKLGKGLEVNLVIRKIKSVAEVSESAIKH
jgi:hypothetical protein